MVSLQCSADVDAVKNNQRTATQPSGRPPEWKSYAALGVCTQDDGCGSLPRKHLGNCLPYAGCPSCDRRPLPCQVEQHPLPVRSVRHRAVLYNPGSTLAMEISLEAADRTGPEILVLADDLTGALESGAAFAQRGIQGTVTLLKARSTGKPVLVVDTETRHVSEAEAVNRIEQVSAMTKARLIYKKTDSTLR